MALSKEELQLQIDILTSRTDDNDGMKYSKLPGINKGLNPDFFTGNNTRIVNAINKLAQDVAAMQTAVIDMINKTNGVILDVNSVENQEIWKETKRLMGEDTIIEGIRAILEGKSQDRIFDLDEEDEGKILTVVIDDAGNPIIKPIDLDIALPEPEPERPEITSAYQITYLNGDHPEITNVGDAIDHIMDGMTGVGESIDQIMEKLNNVDFEITWDDIKDKPSIGTKLELDDDSLALLSEEDAELSVVPLMSDDDIYDLVNSLD
jgi:hypothetical protein